MARRDQAPGGRQPSGCAPRVGFFGLLGSGNSGNDVSMETMLRYLRDAHPEVVLDAMSGEPQRLQARYGLEAVPLYWYQRFEDRAPGAATPFLKALGKGLDAARIASWVRRHDVVFVPGAGALEATLPTRPWGFPYTLFVLSASGRLFRTRIALVSVGANDIKQRATRMLSNWTARMAFYRSYRDAYSRDAMRRRGIDTSRDGIYPDLAFGMPTPPWEAGDPQLVGVGVMDYYGGNDDRRQAAELHATYVDKVTRVVQWLVDSGHRVLLFGGDTKYDVGIAEQIRTEVRRQRPGLGPEQIVMEPGSSYQELMQALSPVGTVIATRYHNVICALKLGKPTIALGYSEKFAPLMVDMGLAEFTESASSFDVAMLTERLTELEKRHGELQQMMAERNAAKLANLEDQFAVLSTLLFAAREPALVQLGKNAR
jgi:polysaccharide pyruvyl transferase WcaK-like protein